MKDRRETPNVAYPSGSAGCVAIGMTDPVGVAEPVMPSGNRRDGTSDGVGIILFKASGSEERYN